MLPCAEVSVDQQYALGTDWRQARHGSMAALQGAGQRRNRGTRCICLGASARIFRGHASLALLTEAPQEGRGSSEGRACAASLGRVRLDRVLLCLAEQGEKATPGRGRTHGRTGLAHVLLGSVAEKLAAFPRPVPTIPDKMAQELRAVGPGAQSRRATGLTSGSSVSSSSDTLTGLVK
jgi:hypothetical protein